MVGKTFKGMTDELLAWQTATFPSLAREEPPGAAARGAGGHGHEVLLRPELVVEIELDGVQRSPRYPGGVALRFARVLRYRPDKTPAEADTIDAVRALLRD
jgi:DNA ligase-1